MSKCELTILGWEVIGWKCDDERNWDGDGIGPGIEFGFQSDSKESFGEGLFGKEASQFILGKFLLIFDHHEIFFLQLIMEGRRRSSGTMFALGTLEFLRFLDSSSNLRWIFILRFVKEERLELQQERLDGINGSPSNSR